MAKINKWLREDQLFKNCDVAEKNKPLDVLSGKISQIVKI